MSSRSWIAALAVCVAASSADAKPKKKKKPRPNKPAPTAPAPAPVAAPTPAPVPEPVPVAAPVAAVPAPAPVAVVANGRPRVAVLGDAVYAKPFAKAIESKVEIVSADEGPVTAIAAKHDLHAVIVVSSPTSGTGLAIVYQGSDGAELGRAEVKAAKFLIGKKLGPEVLDKLGGKLAVATAPASGARVAANESGSSSSSSGGGPSTDGVVSRAPRPQRPRREILITVEERPFWRRLRYNDDLDDRLRPSDLVANAVGVGGSWRPLQNFRNFSVLGRGELAVGVNGSRTSDGTAYSTSSSEWGLGVGIDVGIAGARVGVAATYGEQRFSLDDDPMMELVPDVTYRFARGGLVVAVPLAARWDLTVTAGWRQLLGMGGLTDDTWFPRATGAGLDGSAGIALHVTPWLNFHASIDLRRYFFAMNPVPGDPWVAGGATDQYFGGAIGLAVSPR